MNLDRFDGYPDRGEQKAKVLSVFERWKLLGCDPADDWYDARLCAVEHTKDSNLKEPHSCTSMSRMN